jgi:hypothetical protein
VSKANSNSSRGRSVADEAQFSANVQVLTVLSSRQLKFDVLELPRPLASNINAFFTLDFGIK